MKSKPNKFWISILILLFFNIILFSYSVNIRQKWFGILAGNEHDSTGHHQWLTGSTLVFVKNWLNEGPTKLKFGLFQNPLSIETANNRAPYGSYPPGVIIPIYLLAKISGANVNPGLVMSYNLFTHLMISISLSLITYYTLKQLKVDETQSIIASFFPTIIQFLLPHPLYHHQNSYFSDQAVMLPYVLFILLEIIRFDSNFKRYSKQIKAFQVVVNVWGLLTDWLFIFLNFFTYIKRIIQNQITKKSTKDFQKQSLFFWFPSLTIIFLFLVQIFSIGAFEIMKKRFILRVGLNPEFADYQNKFIRFIYYHLQTGYGKFAPHIIFVSIILIFLWIFLAKKQKLKLSKNLRNTLSTIFSLAVFTPLLQMIVFRNHTAIHDFSVLKLSVFLSLIPFTLLPILFIKLFEKSSNKKIHALIKNQKHTIYPKILLLLLAYSLLTHQRYRYLFPEPNYLMEDIGNFVNQNTSYQDILFSSDITVRQNPPQMLSYTMKRIYEANIAGDIIKIIEPIKNNYNIVILEQVPTKNNPQEIQAIKQLSNKVLKGKNANLYFISKEDFWSIIKLQ